MPPPNRRLSGFFREKLALLGRSNTSFYLKCSVGLKYAKNALAAGAHDAPPDPLVGWGAPFPNPNPH